MFVCVFVCADGIEHAYGKMNFNQGTNKKCIHMYVVWLLEFVCDACGLFPYKYHLSSYMNDPYPV